MNDLEEAEQKRSQQTKLLMIGGAISLALPLAGVAYLRLSDSAPPPVNTAGAIFDRRDTQPITPLLAAQPSAAAPAAKGNAGSLGMISGGGEYFVEAPQKPANALQQAAQQAGQELPAQQAKPAEEPKAQAAAKAQQPQKKAWSPPRLNTGGMGASRFGPQVGGGLSGASSGLGQSGVGGSAGMGGGAPPGGMPPGMPDMSAMMGAAGGAGGAPDMSAMMKNMPQGAGGGLPPMPAGGMPQMPNMPQMPPQGGQ